MHARRFGLGLAIGLFFSTSFASAILIDTGAGKVGGFVLIDDGTNLKIRILTPDGQEIEKNFERGKIQIIHELDVKLLEGLSPDNPKAYFDYAEELARHKADPEARERAKELYLIAAKLKPKELGSKSLLSMSALAESEAEARKYRAMAYLLDPKADAKKILTEEAGKAAPSAQIPARALEDFLNALRLYRAGKIKEAEETAQHEGVDKLFSMALPGKFDRKTFLKWCNDAFCPKCEQDGTVTCSNCVKGAVLNKSGGFVRVCPLCKKGRKVCPSCGGTHVRDYMPDEAPPVVLRCELWALDKQGWSNNPARKADADAKSWSAVVKSRRLSPVLPLSLETMIARFDPSKCLYRNRKWVEQKSP